MTERRSHHGGESAAKDGIDFSVNLNPLGMPSCALRVLREDLNAFEQYPDTECSELRKLIAQQCGSTEEQVVCGAGAADLIYRIPSALNLKKVLLTIPSFSEYERSFRENGTEITYLKTSEKAGFVLTEEYRTAGAGYDAIVIASPGNPSGRMMSPVHYRSLLKWCAETSTLLIADECFVDFAEPASRRELQEIRREIPGAEMILLRSFTKIYAMAGLRIGYALFDDPEKAEKTSLAGPPWNVSGPAQRAAAAALTDQTGFLQRTVQLIRQEREKIRNAFQRAGLKVYESEVNFLLFEASESLGEAMAEKGLILRDCSDYPGLPLREKSHFYRVAVRSESDNDRLIREIEDYQKTHAGIHSDEEPTCDMAEFVRKERMPGKRKAASIMIQGTMSNAGKSLLAAGLCRIFLQDGFHPAPFKSQNMALNSHITADGKEIGRAQAVQAEAAGIEPVSDMNPILLKPTTEKGSQVIVNGEVRCSMDASDYFEYRKTLKDDVLNAYRRLEETHDVIVIEGAGSPVEINLNRNGDDFVNMGLAESVDAPVLLAGDIDRGGVFAQLGGTVMLMDHAARARIRGLIVNKFRGDLSLFEEGKSMLQEICGAPVIGVVPYMDVDIDDEDSLSSRLMVHAVEQEEEEELKIAVIRLPHISNFSDLTALDAVEGVKVYYADRPEHLRPADAILLPGTKNTMEDLEWLFKTGLAESVKNAAEKGTAVTGICGGYQMLGETIRDCGAVESSRVEMSGLGLLPVYTEYEQKKVTLQRRARTSEAAGIPEELRKISLSGYEIHMGRSRILSKEERNLSGWNPEKNASAFSLLDSGEEDGCFCGNVFGTYLHGLFDHAEFALAYSRWAARCCQREIKFKTEDYQLYKEAQYDKLAGVLRQSLDLDALYEIMGLRRDTVKSSVKQVVKDRSQ